MHPPDWPATATFLQEQTIQRTCPPGAPPVAFCFTGSDHSGTGTSTPPGGTATDDGTWRILGGTGRFEDATGSGTVHTQATGGTGKLQDPIASFSTYTGTVTLH